MVRYNIAYDYEYDEEKDKINVVGKVDIIEVSEEIANNIDFYLQNFFDWTAKNKSNLDYDNVSKRVVCQITGDDFVKYLVRECNANAKVIKTNVDYDKTLHIIEFWF